MRSSSWCVVFLVVLLGWSSLAADQIRLEPAGGSESLLQEGKGNAPIPSNKQDSTTTPSQAAAVALKAAKDAQAAAAATSASQQNKLSMLLKPPGCRPTTQDDLLNYDRQRTKCAQTKPAPSAYTTPPTQTPVEVALTDIKVVGLDDKNKQFVVEMTRTFRWMDQKAETIDTAMLWNPVMAFSFPDSLKVETLTPVAINHDGVHLSLTEQLRVTLHNSWDYRHFPFDKRTFVIRLASTLTSVLEPITLRMDPVALPDDMFGFTPKTELVGSIVKDTPSGPKGAWGNRQTIQLTADASRQPWSNIIRILIPITLCTLIVYAGFFMKIAELMPRVATAVLALLIQFTYMNVIAASMPTRSYIVWAEYWLMIQAILVSIGCCHHAVCHFLNVRYGETKYVHLDMAMRVTYPLIFILSFFWAQSVVAWSKVAGYIFLIISILVTILIFIAIFAVLERRTAARYEKTHYPGI